MNPPPRFNVLGTGVHALSLEQAAADLAARRGERRRGYVCCATAYNVNLARGDAALRAAYNRSLFTTPDGMPLVWLGRAQGHTDITRVYGPDLMLAVCDRGRAAGLRHFFFGGLPGVAEKLRAALTARLPGLEIAGTFVPPFRELTPGEFARLQRQIAESRADIVWVGLGTPKQEKFMAGAWEQLDASALIGVGAAFDFLSGRVPQAPRWMQRSGLEWLHRLATEPGRLWPRYLVHNPMFVVRTLAQTTGLRKYPLD
ncbi:MAG: glycosyltransferase [Opitutus sp.]|nr:glycosyltransferase [Opitutus sp.]